MGGVRLLQDLAAFVQSFVQFCASFVLQATKACSDGVGSLDSHLLSNKASYLIALVAVLRSPQRSS